MKDEDDESSDDDASSVDILSDSAEEDHTTIPLPLKKMKTSHIPEPQASPYKAPPVIKKPVPTVPTARVKVSPVVQEMKASVLQHQFGKTLNDMRKLDAEMDKELTTFRKNAATIKTMSSK